VPERPKGEDRTLPISQVVKCSRKLAPGEVKRTLTTGALVGYTLACPGCGFIETQQDLDDGMGFVERAGQLVGARESYRCTLCRRTVTLKDGTISARQTTP